MKKMSDEDNHIYLNTSAQLLNYDNCIIRDHSHSDSSSSSVFSWKNNQMPTESSLIETSDNNDDRRFENVSDEEWSNVELDLKDSFILMVGFLNKIEKYFNGNADDVYEKETLQQQLVLIKTILINSSESFGHRQFQHFNETLYSNNKSDEAQNVEKQETTKKIVKKARKTNLNQIDTQTYAQKMDDEIKINNLNVLTKQETKSALRRSTRIQNYASAERNKSCSEFPIPAKNVVPKKRAANSPQRSSKRIKYKNNLDRLSQTASKLKLVISGKTTPIKRKSWPGTKQKNLDLQSKKKAHSSNFNKRKSHSTSRLNSEIKTDTGSDKNPSPDKSTNSTKVNKEEIPDQTITTGSGRRKLYSADSWISMLSFNVS